jgi:hypothetical protein
MYRAAMRMRRAAAADMRGNVPAAEHAGTWWPADRIGPMRRRGE